MIDDHWPRPKEDVKIINDKRKRDGYTPRKPLKHMKPFPDPEKAKGDLVTFEGGPPYLNTVAANSLLGVTKYYGLNNARYFRDKGYHPADNWGQLGMPNRNTTWTNADTAKEKFEPNLVPKTNLHLKNTIRT